jgi:hypothetical protein
VGDGGGGTVSILDFRLAMFSLIIMYMKKLLEFDWLRAVQV